MSVKKTTISMPELFYNVAQQKYLLRYATFSSYITHLIAIDCEEEIKAEYKRLKNEKDATEVTP